MRLAGAMHARGLAKGDRVGVLLPNSTAVLDVHFAAAAKRTVVVVRARHGVCLHGDGASPLLPRVPPQNLNTHLVAPELAYLLEVSGPKMLVRARLCACTLLLAPC